MDLAFLNPEELARELGLRLQRLRIQRDLEQKELASRSGVSLRTLRALERGEGSSVLTLLRVLKALDALEGIALLAPQPTISPMALLRHPKERQRVRKSKGEKL